ncbi:MAG: hypothetical protein ACR2J6_01680 [Thermoleophilaceae bacterium]
MSNRARVGVIALAVVVVALAFVALRPTDSSKKADPAKAGKTEASGGAKEPTATAPSAPPPPQEITLKAGVPQGGIKSIRVKKGDIVRLQVITDEQGDQLHLHGYDIEKEAKAGRPANFRFRAGVEGVFELESHTAEHAGREPLIARLVVAPS